MSVLIKGMEMPTSCAVCSFENYGDCYGGKVKAIMDIDDYVSAGKRHPRCPLVPVPPHGRLIEKHDVFKLISAFPEIDKLLTVEFMNALYNLPTIIQGEEATQMEGGPDA